jgi:hypothetical protein
MGAKLLFGHLDDLACRWFISLDSRHMGNNWRYALTRCLSVLGFANKGLELQAGVQNSARAFKWSLDSSLGAEEMYALKISLDSDPDTVQYGTSFKISSAGVATSIATSGTSTFGCWKPCGELIRLATIIATSGGSFLSTATIGTTTTGSTVTSIPNPISAGSGAAGLSAGTIAGISVAAVASLALIASLLALTLYYRRKAQARMPGEDSVQLNPDLDGATRPGTAQQYAGLNLMERNESDSQLAEILYPIEGKSIRAEIFGSEAKSIPGEIYGLKVKGVKLVEQDNPI